MITLRKSLPTFQYPLPANTDGSKMNYWGHGDGSTIIGFHRNAFNFVLCGANAYCVKHSISFIISE